MPKVSKITNLLEIDFKNRSLAQNLNNDFLQK